MKTLLSTFVACTIAASTVMAQAASAPVSLTCEISTTTPIGKVFGDSITVDFTITDNAWTLEGTKNNDGHLIAHDWDTEEKGNYITHSSVLVDNSDTHYYLSVNEVKLYKGHGIRKVTDYFVNINRETGKLAGKLNQDIYLKGHCRLAGGL